MTFKKNNTEELNGFFIDLTTLSLEIFREKYCIVEDIDTTHWVYGCRDIAINENRIDDAYLGQIVVLIEKLKTNNTF